jgi:putative DNA primase/helicase
MMSLQEIARAMGGVVATGGVNAPGPGHKPSDRSLRIFLDTHKEDGIRVHSFAGDDPIACKDYVGGKLGLPAWQPSRPSSNGHAKLNGSNGHAAAAPVKIEAEAIVAPVQDHAACANLPSRTPPNEEGKPKFFPWSDDGPPRRSNEIRRHVYKRDGLPVRIKVKSEPEGNHPAFVNWYRVSNDGEPGWQAKKPDGYVPAVYLGAIDPFDPELAGDPIHWPEGEKDCDTLGKINLPAFTFGGVGDGLPENAAMFLAARHVVILADNDEPGRKHAEAKAALATEAGAASVRVVHFPELQSGGDVSDYIGAGGTEATLTQHVEAAALWTPAVVEAVKPRPEPRALAMLRASDIELKAVEWLWPGKFALGKITLIAGEPGLGKSQLTAALAATVTTGGRWPTSDQRSPRGCVVMFSAEDDASDTIAPRLLAAGADLKRIQIVSAVHGGDKTPGRRSFNFQTDLDLLEKAMQDLGDVRLVVIDPITSYLGKGVDSHKNAEVRSVLEPVAELAARYSAAFVGITHFSKGGGSSAINRFIGSIAFIAAARAAFVVTNDPDSDIPGRRLFLPVKNNLAPKGDGLSFQIEQHMIAGEICASMVEWGGDVVTKTADEILSAGAEDDRPQRTEAADLLRASLADGPKPSKEVEAEAKDAGISWRTIKRAKKELGILAEPRPIKRTNSGDGPPVNRWYWSLPNLPSGPPKPQGGHVPDVAPLGEVGPLRGDGGDL